MSKKDTAKKVAKKTRKKAKAKKVKTPVKKEPKKNGRPLIEVDWKKVDEMCAIQCTHKEIAAVMGVGLSTLQRASARDHGMTFDNYFKEKSQAGKASLRHLQFKTAKGGSVPMQIHLGKNILDQKDKKELSGGLDLTKPASELTNDELAKIIEDEESESEEDDG